MMYITQNLNVLFVVNNKIFNEIYSILMLRSLYKKTHADVFEMGNNCIMFYDNQYMVRLIFLEIKNTHFPVNSNVLLYCAHQVKEFKLRISHVLS